MGTYKVLQDIESEDKLVGPLSLRQFIYAAIVLVLGFIAYQLGKASFVLALPFLPPMIFFGALAAPLGGAQSSEVWLLAKIRYFIKPRRRIWSQDGIQELVTVTVPKKIEKQLTDNLSQHEVKSRLSALANTLDSRGWAIRGAVNQTSATLPSATSDDRLIAVDSSAPNPVDSTEDVMDETSGRMAQQFKSLLDRSSQQHRQQVIDKVKNPGQPKQPADYWFMNARPGDPKGESIKTVLPGEPQQKSNTDDKGQVEQEFLQKRHQEEARPNPYDSHLKTLQPIDKQKPKPAKPNPNVARLAGNDDLNISTIAREAHKTQDNDDGEVVINLH